MNPFYHDPNEEQKRKLEKHVFASKWERVIEIYENWPELRSVGITASRDTALHMAIFDNQLVSAEKLVSIAADEELKAANEFGNTPLHVAAYMGNAKICDCIAARNAGLIGLRNKSGETPLFVAARHGWKDAFNCLRRRMHDDGRESYAGYRDIDSQTILHTAISGEYFDLAFEIINWYPEFVETIKEMDVKTPLHILASKPRAFRSGTNMGKLDALIYHYVRVEKLKTSSVDNHQSSSISLLRQLSTKIVDPVRQCVKKTDPEDPHGPQHKQGCESLASKAQRLVCYLLKSIPEKVEKIRKEKQKHTWSVQIMERLLENDFDYEASNHSKGTKPINAGVDADNKQMILDESAGVDADNKQMILDESAGVGADNKQMILDEFPRGPDGHSSSKGGQDKWESALLIAAKNGVMEMVKKILEMFPVAIQDTNIEKKNIVLLAIEYRQPEVYKYLIETIPKQPNVYYKMDKDGNGALHLAGFKHDHLQPPGIPGPAMLMQWKIKWYQFVKNSKPPNYFVWRNNNGKTPDDIFIDEHKELMEKSSEWLKSTSESCSVVATLIATVAFATSTAIPGGLRSDDGVPTLGKEPAFSAFGIASLVALCFSVCSTFIFLGFVNSSHNEKDFNKRLPLKLLAGLTCLFISLGAMMVSFCAAHYLIMRDRLNYGAFPLYLLIFLLVTLYASAQFPWYWRVASTTFNNFPQKCRTRQFS